MVTAVNLGIPVAHRKNYNIVYTLIPKPAELGHTNSLTSRFGQGAFPLHTDTAHWRQPARYVILGCVNPGRGRRKTQLLHEKSVCLPGKEQQLVDNAIFVVKRQAGSFLATIFQHEFMRLDFQCMLPVNKLAEEALVAIAERIEQEELIEVDWKPGRMLVIDNWRMLHGRASAQEEDGDRRMLRVLVGKSNNELDNCF